MKTFTFFRITFFAFISLCALGGCTNSYTKAKPVPASDFPDAIEKAKEDNRFFILHSGINVYTITSFQLDKAQQALTVHLNELDSLHIIPVQSRRTRSRKGESPAVNEIHIYTKDSVSYTLDEPHTIPLDKVANIDLLGKG